MPRKYVLTPFPLFLVVTLLFTAFQIPSAYSQTMGSTPSETLTDILLHKGLLTADEAKLLGTTQANGPLARVLFEKGVLSQAEFQQVSIPVSSASELPAASDMHQVVVESPKPKLIPAAYKAVPATPLRSPQQQPNPTEPGAPSVVEKLPVKTVISALTPIRALPVGSIDTRTLHPSLMVNGVGVTPYGFLKATAVEDSSSPNGDDFPLPGFLCDSGPDGAPEFHVKARASRVGANFTWNDSNSRWNINGKIEMDFEGNFNRSDNRNISSVRSSNPSLRLAWGRLDYKLSDADTISMLFGQDWTLFGSSTLPNILETTGLGIGFGTLYERTPQMRVGYTRKIGSLKFMPEVAAVLPAVGLSPSAANISQQLGYGERQGADSNRPDIEARVVTQWQLDHAAGVPPAQIIFSGEYGRRTAVVQSAVIPNDYKTTFPAGVTGTSHTNGWDLEWQLPSRNLTVIGKFYSGADLRYFFAGQLYSFFNDTAGLTDLVSVSSIDGASVVVLGTDARGHQVVAPERPIRAQGGFIQIGLPLSRIFNARPDGRNAGWSFYSLYSIDQAKTRDLNRLGASGNRRYSTMAVATLNYNLNRWISFSAEQSLYTTHANPEQPLPLFRGARAREWNDVRFEFGPVFNF